MINEARVKNSSISIHTDKGVFNKEFLFPIANYILSANKVIILINYYKNPYRNQNAFCLNEKAEVLWQIQDPEELSSNKKKINSPFTDIKVLPDGSAKAWDWDGYRYDLDLETGKLLKAEFVK